MQCDYLVVANLLAGKGEAESKLRNEIASLENKGITYKSIEIRRPQRISQIQLEGLKVGKQVICIGGDGTVSETVGLVLKNDLNVPIRIVSTGTANLINSTLGAGKHEVDVGVASYAGGVSYFLLGVGMGFEERFLEATKQKTKTLLGSLSYLVTALRELLLIKPINVYLKTADKNEEMAVALAVIFNLRPKVYRLFPLLPYREISANDGRLDVYCVVYRNKVSAIFGTLMFHVVGRYGFGLVRHLTVRSVEIGSGSAEKVQIDGEIGGSLPVKVSCAPRRVTIQV